MLATKIKWKWRDQDGTIHYEVFDLEGEFDVISMEAYGQGVG